MGGMAALAGFVAPQFVTPRHSDEGGMEPHNILPRYLLFSPGMDSTAQEPPHEPADAVDVQVRSTLCCAVAMLPAVLSAMNSPELEPPYQLPAARQRPHRQAQHLRGCPVVLHCSFAQV